MIIKIGGTSNRCWSPYVLYGTKKKPRDPSKIKVLKGDLEQGDRIQKLSNYKENAYQIVISFKGRVCEKTVRAVVDEFEQNFMIGFGEDEYHLDAVWHSDTDDDHVHIRIPKMNLKTQTQLQLYFDAKDRNRINAIRDCLDEKYKLESPLNNQPMIREDRISHIDNWRRKSGKKLLDLGNKKERLKIEWLLTESILEMHQAELIDNFDEVKTFIKEQGVQIIRVGYDKPRDFHYLTIENESGKMRIKGEIYNEKFWKNSREDRSEQIETNRKDNPNRAGGGRKFDELREKLDQFSNKRRREIAEKYNPARQRAQKRAEERKRENFGEYKSIREKRALIFTLNPHTSDRVNFNHEFHPVPTIKQQSYDSQEVHKRARRKQVRSDSQGRFVRNRGWENGLFSDRGGKIDEQVARGRLGRIREMRRITREREDQIRREIRGAEQALFASIEESRTTMETELAKNARGIDAEVIKTDSKDRSSANTVRKLVARVAQQITGLGKSIQGAFNEMRKMKLFKQAQEEVSRPRPTIVLTPRR